MAPLTLKIILKNEDKTYNEKHLIYGDVHITMNGGSQPSLGELIEMAKRTFGLEAEEVILKISCEV